MSESIVNGAFVDRAIPVGGAAFNAPTAATAMRKQRSQRFTALVTSPSPASSTPSLDLDHLQPSKFSKSPSSYQNQGRNGIESSKSSRTSPAPSLALPQALRQTNAEEGYNDPFQAQETASSSTYLFSHPSFNSTDVTFASKETGQDQIHSSAYNKTTSPASDLPDRTLPNPWHPSESQQRQKARISEHRQTFASQPLQFSLSDQGQSDPHRQPPDNHLYHQHQQYSRPHLNMPDAFEQMNLGSDVFGNSRSAPGHHNLRQYASSSNLYKYPSNTSPSASAPSSAIHRGSPWKNNAIGAHDWPTSFVNEQGTSGEDHQGGSHFAVSSGSSFKSGRPPGVSTGLALPEDEVIPTAIVIKNIPFQISKEQLLGVMEDLHLPPPFAFNYHFDNGQFRGLAFANFRLPGEAALTVSALSGFDLQGRKLRTEFKRVLKEGEKEKIEREKAIKRMKSQRELYDRKNGPSGSGAGPRLLSANSRANVIDHQNRTDGNFRQVYNFTQNEEEDYGNLVQGQYSAVFARNDHGPQNHEHHFLRSDSALQQDSNRSNMWVHGARPSWSSAGAYDNFGGGDLTVTPSSDSVFSQVPSYTISSSPPESDVGTSISARMTANSNGSGSGSGVNSGNQPDLDLNDPQTLEIYSRILIFKDDLLRDELAFARSLSARQRSTVHLVAKKLGLEHQSLGVGDERYVVVLKGTSAGSLAFAREADGGKVLRHTSSFIGGQRPSRFYKAKQHFDQGDWHNALLRPGYGTVETQHDRQMRTRKSYPNIRDGANNRGGGMFYGAPSNINNLQPRTGHSSNRQQDLSSRRSRVDLKDAFGNAPTRGEKHQAEEDYANEILQLREADRRHMETLPIAVSRMRPTSKSRARGEVLGQNSSSPKNMASWSAPGYDNVFSENSDVDTHGFAIRQPRGPEENGFTWKAPTATDARNAESLSEE